MTEAELDLMRSWRAVKGSACGWGRWDVCCHRAASYEKTVWPACGGVADLIRKSDKLSFDTNLRKQFTHSGRATEASRCPRNGNTIDKSHFCHSFPQCTFVLLWIKWEGWLFYEMPVSYNGPWRLTCASLCRWAAICSLSLDSCF